jgi:predicted CoA-binding protein
MPIPISDEEIKKILTENTRIAVVGLSPVPARPSYGVTRYMMNHGYEIFGIRPQSPPEILGRPMVNSLSELSEPVDIIDVFRSSDAIPELVDEIEVYMKTSLLRPPKVLWLQEGVTHPQAEEKARQLGLKVISNRCILKEHARLIG